MTDKIKITKQEFDENYEVEEELTQPKIEDTIDKGLEIPQNEIDADDKIEQEMFPSEEELE